jgi:hypothetical protein
MLDVSIAHALDDDDNGDEMQPIDTDNDGGSLKLGVSDDDDDGVALDVSVTDALDDVDSDSDELHVIITHRW